MTGYNPNHIPAGERMVNIVLSSVLLLYGITGLIRDDIYIPGKRRPGMHFHGEPMLLLFIAFLCAAANMMSVVVDHYDKRNNETDYKRFARTSQVSGWTFFISAMILDLLVFHKAT